MASSTVGDIADDPPQEDHVPLGRRIGKGALWGGASAIVFRVANIGIAIIVARLLDPRDFGVFAVAVTVNAILFNISELGVSANLIRNDLVPASISPTITTISIATSSVLATLMFSTAAPLARVLGSPAAAGPIRVLSIGVLLVGFFATPSALLGREFRQDKRFLAEVLGFIVSSVLLIALARAGSGAMAFAWSRVGGQLVAGSSMVYMAGQRYSLGWKREQVRSLLRFGLPLAGANLFNYTLLNVDYIAIGRLLGAVPLGFYLLAFNMSSWASGLLGSMVNSVAGPAFARVKDDRELVHQYLRNAIRAVSTVAFPVSVVSLVFASPIIRTVYGQKWAAAAPALAALAIYGSVRVLCELYGNVMVGMGRTRTLFLMQLGWLMTLIPAMIVGVRTHGIVGAGLAHLGVTTLLVLPFYVHLIGGAVSVGWRFVLRAAGPALVGSLVAGAAGSAAATAASDNLGRLLIGLPVFGVSYLLLLAPWFGSDVRRYLANRSTHSSVAVDTSANGVQVP
ncbi:MAG TPA: lipopolysaccharide biosynthesis protein [Acidimicrobiales bacterium]|nr:lipopolysaccharide biosynthesis protein [Acidimicrobiales bacterium]